LFVTLPLGTEIFSGGGSGIDDHNLSLPLDMGHDGILLDDSNGQAVIDCDMHTLDWSDVDAFWNSTDPLRW